MPWHFAEHVACVLWARPERKFCTRAQPSRHVAPLALARPQGRAPASPTHQNPPGRPWSPTVPPSGRPWQLAAGHSRLLPWTAPPEPPSLASSPLEQCPLVS